MGVIQTRLSSVILDSTAETQILLFARQTAALERPDQQVTFVRGKSSQGDVSQEHVGPTSFSCFCHGPGQVGLGRKHHLASPVLLDFVSSLFLLRACKSKSNKP